MVNRNENFRLITCHHESFQMLNYYEFTYDKFSIKSFIRHEMRNETTIESDSRLLSQKLKWNENNWQQNMTPTGCNMIKFMQIISRAENESLKLLGFFVSNICPHDGLIYMCISIANNKKTNKIDNKLFTNWISFLCWVLLAIIAETLFQMGHIW